MSKCDLHIHSRYSARSEEWLFRRFDFPDSYSDPRELHRQLLERGMDYVTITDHDTIEGCLQIMDLPHSFISEQVTTYFPQDPCKIDMFANRHNLAPTHADPWIKIFTGGSDDHGGQFIASAYTETPPAHSAEKFLANIRSGACTARGGGGTPLAISHSFYNTVACYIQDRFHEKLGPSAILLEQMFSRFMEGRDPTEFSLKEKVGFIAQGVLSGKIFDLAKPANRSLWKELSGYFAQPEVKAKLNDEISAVPEPERRAFLFANLVTEQLTFRLFKKFVQQISGGNLVESMQALSAIAPILVILTPYLYGFHSQAPSRKWLRAVFKEL